MRFLLFLSLILITTGCVGNNAAGLPPPMPTAAEKNTAVESPTARTPPTLPTPLPTTAPIITAIHQPTLGPEPTFTAIPDPLYPLTIDGLRASSYSPGEITITGRVADQEYFIHRNIAYQSDGLTITGWLHQPIGEGPFPVIILLHGFMPRDDYWRGWGTWQAADYFARRGFITIAPDLRSWGGSDWGISLFQTGLVRDVNHLISAVPSLPAADPSRIGLWGHSMGGGIATKVALTNPTVDAAVLYAPNSADDADLIARWGAACRPDEIPYEDFCNPSEILPADTDPLLIEAYYTAANGGPLLREVAPIYHLEKLEAPLQIHIGTEDGQTLSGTPPEWSAKLAAALDEAERPHEYYIYEGQGHFFEGESWMLMMERSLALFERTLAP